MGGLVEAGGLEDVVQTEEAVGATSDLPDGLLHGHPNRVDRLLLGTPGLTAGGFLREGQSTSGVQLEETTRAELEDLDRGEVGDRESEGSEDSGGEGLGHDELQSDSWFLGGGFPFGEIILTRTFEICTSFRVTEEVDLGRSARCRSTLPAVPFLPFLLRENIIN